MKTSKLNSYQAGLVYHRVNISFVSSMYFKIFAPIEALKCNFPPFSEIMTDQPTDQRTDRDRPVRSYDSNKRGSVFLYVHHKHIDTGFPSENIHTYVCRYM